MGTENGGGRARRPRNKRLAKMNRLMSGQLGCDVDAKPWAANSR